MATEKTLPCANCKMRAKYDRGERGFIARFWHWHIGFCPGWKAYFSSLPQEEQKALSEKYGIKRKNA